MEQHQGGSGAIAGFRLMDMRVTIDDRDLRGGEKTWSWVKKDVPLRIDVGPRDIAAGSVFVARRDTGEKEHLGSTWYENAPRSSRSFMVWRVCLPHMRDLIPAASLPPLAVAHRGAQQLLTDALSNRFRGDERLGCQIGQRRTMQPIGLAMPLGQR